MVTSLCALGRIHQAAISGIDTERCFVAVEWFENNETKGKEVSGLYLESYTLQCCFDSCVSVNLCMVP